MRLFGTVFILLSFLTLVVGVVIWNHNVQPIPKDIRVDNIIVGKTTVGEAMKILGSSSTCRSCTGTTLYKFIPAESPFYGREVEIDVRYWGADTGISVGTNKKAITSDAEAVVFKVSVYVYPRLNTESDNIFERTFASVLDWEYDLWQ